MDPTSVILLLDFAARVAPSIAALVERVKAGDTVTQADIDRATAAAHAAADAWDASGDRPE